MFPLVRLFIVTSLVAIAVVVATLVYYRQGEIARLITFAESQNVELAQSVANSVWPRFSPYITSATDLDRDTLKTRPETEQISNSLKVVTAGLPILKVKIYNLNGVTIYSTIREEIGEDKSDNLGFFAAARGGKPASKLTSEDSVSSFEGSAGIRDAVESYLPIRGKSGQIEGVFEIYTDVTSLLSSIKHITRSMAICLTALFVILYGALFLIVRRAERTIKSQYTDISDKNTALTREIAQRERFEAELKSAHDELEERVAARTRELTDEIAERRRVEEQVRRHRDELTRVGAVVVMGEMATSIAHELNQPLTVISGCAQVCKKELRSSAVNLNSLRDSIEQLADQSQRASDILQRVRGFISKNEEERDRIDLNLAIHDLMDLLQPDAHEHECTIELELAGSLPPVWADIIQIQQVIINLAHNAFEAMAVSKSKQRCLTIRTSVLKDGTVEVAVGDTGDGLPAAALSHVFDPFYTTKPDGLGMGLAISRSIIERHGGRFWVSSDDENETVFRFVLPVADDKSGTPSH